MGAKHIRARGPTATVTSVELVLEEHRAERRLTRSARVSSSLLFFDLTGGATAGRVRSCMSSIANLDEPDEPHP